MTYGKERPFSGPPTTSTLTTVRKKKLKATNTKLPKENVIIGTWNVCTSNQRKELKKRPDVGTGQVQMGHNQTLRDTITSVVRLSQKKDMACGLVAMAEDNNMDWASS